MGFLEGYFSPDWAISEESINYAPLWIFGLKLIVFDFWYLLLSRADRNSHQRTKITAPYLE